MKRTIKSMLGVTLLEIMLVLAIAAMVIVMSIRYYQQAASNQRITNYASTLTGIMAAAESYIQSGSGTTISASTLAPYLPGNVAPTISPWGTGLTIGGTTTAVTVTVSGITAAECTKLTNLMASNRSITFTAGTCATTTITP